MKFAEALTLTHKEGNVRVYDKSMSLLYSDKAEELAGLEIDNAEVIDYKFCEGGLHICLDYQE